MAEDKLELELKVDKAKAEKDFDDTTKSILEVRKSQQLLNKMLKDGSVTQHQYAKSTAENKVKLGELNSSQKQSIQISKSSSGSIKELSASLAKNKKQYDNLTKEQRTNIDVGGKLLKTIQAQDKEYKNAKASMGVYSPEVGNYKNKVKEALTETGLFNQGLAGSSGGLGMLKGGLGSAVKGFTTLKGAIISTGLGALVIVLGSVYQWFTKTEKGAQKLRVIMAVIGQVTDSFMDVLTNLGETLFNVFNNPKEAVQGFGNSIKEFLIDRVEALLKGVTGIGSAFAKLFTGDFKGALETGKKAVGDLLDATPIIAIGKSIKDNVVEGYKKVVDLGKELVKDGKAAASLAKRENDLKVKNRAFLIEEAKLNVEIAKTRALAANKNQSDLKRAEHLKKALELQEVLEKKRITLKQEQLDILAEQQAISITDEEGMQKRAELEAELINLEASRAMAKRKIITELTSLEKKIQADKDKVEAARVKKEEADLKSKLDKQKELTATFNEEKKTLEDELYIASLATDAERAQYKLDLELEREKERVKNIGLSKEEETELLLGLEKKYHNQSLALTQEAEKTKGKLDKVTTDDKIGNVQSTFSTVASAAGKETKIAKTAGVAAAGISTYKGIAKTLETYPYPLSAIMAVAQGLIGLQQVTKISGIQIPSFSGNLPKASKGGSIYGNSHAMGGVKLEGEDGEFIVNNRAMSNPTYASIVKQINANGNNGGSTGAAGAAVGITEERVVELASMVVKSVPVHLNETEDIEKKRSIKLRESKFTTG